MTRSKPRLVLPRPACRSGKTPPPPPPRFHRQLRFEALEVRTLLAAGDLDLTFDGDAR